MFVINLFGSLSIVHAAASTCASSAAGFCIQQLSHPDEASFYLKERLWSSRPGDYRVRQTEKIFPCGLNARVKPSSRRNCMKVIFRDDEKRVFTVCSKESSVSSSSSLTYKVLSAAPTLPGNQRPAKKTSSSRRCLYHWAKVTVSSPMVPTYTLSIWDGTEFVDTYTCTRRNSSGGSNNINSAAAVSRKHYSFMQGGGTVCGVMEKGDQCGVTQWHVSVLPSFDPCLMLCFASIVDDLLHLASLQEALSLRDLALSLSGMMVSKQTARTSLGEKSLSEASSGESAAAFNESATSLGLAEPSKPRSGSSRAA